VLGFTGLFLGAPLAVLVERSLRTAGGYGFDHYRQLAGAGGRALFVSPLEALFNSLGYALTATMIALVVGLLAAVVVARKNDFLARFFDVLLMLPLGTSAVTIGLGFLVALDQPVDLRTSPILIPLAHALVAVPFVVRSSVPVLRSARTRLREAAVVLGAPPSRVWREIDLPLVSRAALVAGGFAFAISLGEFGATALIVRPDTTTLPVAIFRLLSQPGSVNFGQAMALATILMLVTAMAVAVIERFRLGGAEEF
jgi:thiamine transport system permease protein